MQEDDIQESKYIPMYYFQNRFVYSFHILNHTALHLINEVYSLSPLKKYIKNTLCPKMYFVDFDTMLCIGLLYCISGYNSVHFYYIKASMSQKNRSWAWIELKSFSKLCARALQNPGLCPYPSLMPIEEFSLLNGSQMLCLRGYPE